MAKHTDAEYANCDPFEFEEDMGITCQTVTIRMARKRHVCYGLTGKQDHHIELGQPHRHEKARTEVGWGEYRLCFDCLDRFMAGDC